MARILVVDDEITSIAILRKVLEEAGHKVTTVVDGEMAIEKIKEFKYDILFNGF